jgi:beta-lactamase class D
MKRLLLTVLSCALTAFIYPNYATAIALTETEFKKLFEDRDGCFVMSDLKTGKILSEYNPKRCQERFSPCSSFKIAAALMAFEKKVLKDDHQVIKWDGVKREPQIHL